MKNGRRGKPELGRYDYDGAWIPKPGSQWRTFSIGIFQWIYAREGVDRKRIDRTPINSLKRGLVICRVRGLTSEPEMVYDLAEELCENMEGSNFRYAVRGKTFTAERQAK